MLPIHKKREKRRLGILSSSSMNILSNHATTSTNTTNTGNTTAGNNKATCTVTSSSINTNTNDIKTTSTNAPSPVVTTSTITTTSNSTTNTSNTSTTHTNTTSNSRQHCVHRSKKEERTTTVPPKATTEPTKKTTNRHIRSNDNSNSNTNSSNAHHQYKKTNAALSLGEIYQGCLQAWNQQKQVAIASCMSPRSSSRYNPREDEEEQQQQQEEEQDLSHNHEKHCHPQHPHSSRHCLDPHKHHRHRDHPPPPSSSSLQTNNNSNNKNNNNMLPGIFHLMDQHQWERVQKRALKYPKECRISAVISNSTSSQGQTTETNTTEMQGWYKCKALHYACHRLRRVHGYIRKGIAESMTALDDSVEEEEEEDEEQVDPWVEACKAVLVILKQYPEAAKMRESKHGCLPIHLAVFAMCPTPSVGMNVEEEEEMDEGEKCGRDDDAGTMEDWEGQGVDANAVPPPPPSAPLRGRSGRPLGSMQRRLSHSSSMDDSVSGSSFLGGLSQSLSRSQSLDGWSVNMEQECGRGMGHVLDFELEKLEVQLRSRSDGKLSPLEEANLLESARLLSGGGGGKGTAMLSKPSSLHSIMSMTSDGGRSISMGSYASSCSVSVMSAASSVHASAPTTSLKRRRFNWKKYMANQETREEYSLKVLNALLDAYPKCVRVDSEGGRLPLHTAVAGKATLSIIETLAKAYPYACRHRNMENSLPLHLAACYGVSDPGVAPMLLRLYPYACVGRNRWERTPLEEALLKGGENGREHQEALCWVLRKPPEYWTGGYFGDSVTYDELRRRFVPTDMVGRDGPHTNDATKKTNSMGKEDDLISLIRERQWEVIVDNIDEFKEQANKSTKCEVRGGQIAIVSALYFACEFDPSYQVLDALVNACPGATTWRKQPGGQLPIHALCTWGGSREAIAFLLAASPESAKRRDDSGNLALHAACYSGAPESIVQSLLLCDPKSVHVMNIQGSTPRDIVCQLSHRNRKKVLRLIENVSLELLEKKRCREKKKLIENQINSQIDKVLEVQSNTIKEKSKRSFFRFSRKEKKDESYSGGDNKPQQQSNSAPRTNITGSPPPEENIEVSLEEECCEDLLWV